MEKSSNRALAQKYSIDFSIAIEVAQILARRFSNYDEAKKFLFPNQAQLYDIKTIPDIQIATEEIIGTINRGEGILIYCHDDLDGYTSAAIMYKTLTDLCRPKGGLIYVYPIIREKDGYILNSEVLRHYRQKGVNLIITVDFGISNINNFSVAQEENLKLIICDHHETSLNDFTAPAVDPKRVDSKYPFRELAGVGVTFKLAQSLYQKAFKLKAEEFYNLKKEFFPITLLGTISDRVILQDENRVFCVHGLELFKTIDKHWINFFRKEGDLNWQRITSEIIPVFGSASYLDPNLGVGILISEDEKYIATNIAKLKSVDNDRRQAIDALFEEAVMAAKIFPGIVISVIPFSKPHYLGSVAARLKSHFKRTTVVVGFKEGKCLGELRSYGLDLYQMLSRSTRLFLDFGGHKKAAGFSMLQENLDKFIDDTVSYVANHMDDKSTNPYSANNIPEAILNKADINILTCLAPFGEGNPPPVLTDGTNVYTIDNSFKIIEIEKDK